MHSPCAPAMPVASLGSTNFAKHRYKSFDNARWPWASIYTMRESTAGRWGGKGWEWEGAGKEKGGEECARAGNLAIRQAHRRRCKVRTPAGASFGRPNVSDDATDIANCKNYHRGTSPAVSRTGLFNPCPSPGFEFDTIAGNLDVSFNAKPQRQRCCYHSSMCAKFRENFSNIHPYTRTHTLGC